MVILINSPLFKDGFGYDEEDSLPPIGLGLIATHLRNNDIDVEIIDSIANKISLSELKQTILCLKPEFIGINIFTTNYELVKELVESIDFDTHFLIGGQSTKSLYTKIVDWKTQNNIDVVIGDGEYLTLDIVLKDIKESPIQEILNRRVFKVDQNSKYFLVDISNVPLDRSLFLNEPYKNQYDKLEMNIITGRGCIHNCTFCAAARRQNHDYPIRERSVHSVIHELNDIAVLYPDIQSIRILDDLFLKSRTSIFKALEIFSRYNYQWRSMAHVKTFNQVEQSEIKSLKESGCMELFIGIESGSEHILKDINKTHDKSLIIRNLTKLFQEHINVKGYFIFGFPDETESDMKMTYNLAYELKEIATRYGTNFRTSVFQFRPYHGSEIYEKLNEKFNLNSVHVTANQSLTDLIGRSQFNFKSRNFSKVSLKTIHEYICRTNQLNGSGIYTNRNQRNNKPKQAKKVQSLWAIS